MQKAAIHPPSAIAALWQATQAAGFGMASDPLAGALLRTLAASKPGGRLLELGTGTGLSTAWLLNGMDAHARLLSVDNDPALLAIARQHLGHDRRLQLACEDGDALLHQLAGQQFDFVFADTWPGKYRLLDEALALLAPGGLYLVDDMLPQANWPEGHADKVTALLTTLEQRSNLHVSKLSWASGLVIASRCADA